MKSILPSKMEIEYLKKLQRDIHDDKSLNIDLQDNYIRDLKSSLDFFNELNIELHEVEDINCRFIKVGDIETIIDPSFIRSRLIRQVYSCDQHISKIIIGNSDKRIAYGSYIHEIMHTQVHKYGYTPQVKEDYNVEILPMFVELLYANNNGNKDILYRRIENLKDYIPDYLLYYNDDNAVLEDDKLRSERYIKSFLKAIHLLNIYKELDNDSKKQLISYINDVIIGRITLEDMLKNYNVKYENSAYELKVLKRSI